MEPQHFNTNYQHQLNENLTAVENAPLIAPLSSNENDAENELRGGETTNLYESLATVIPISAIIPNEPSSINRIKQQKPSNDKMTASYQTIAIVTQTPRPPPSSSLQIKNATKISIAVSRNQQNPRTAIKSSSPSAVANNTHKNHKPDAPMLNYIFDSHLATNKHHHYDRYALSVCYLSLCIYDRG